MNFINSNFTLRIHEDERPFHQLVSWQYHFKGYARSLHLMVNYPSNVAPVHIHKYPRPPRTLSLCIARHAHKPPHELSHVPMVHLPMPWLPPPPGIPHIPTFQCLFYVFLLHLDIEVFPPNPPFVLLVQPSFHIACLFVLLYYILKGEGGGTYDLFFLWILFF